MYKVIRYDLRYGVLEGWRKLLLAVGMGALVLVNATSAGFGDQRELCPIPDAGLLRADLHVADVIYSPEETVFLKMARGAGCKAMNGIGMMLYQGAASFKLWTGREMPIDAVKAVL